VNAFIDEHRARCGVEPICRALQVAPSAYRRHAARQRNPALLPARARRDAHLLAQVQRVYDQNLRVYVPTRCGASSGAKARPWRAAPSNG
jgi:hypothetical protein